ncbi:hypothetical protein psal_cds_788 [Pandoravirus salinus]|uniref:Uncharacterized protein n=1 Tax=Pandoravirus salinus TaxID=1349410 RepID=S4W3F5_9VIRU|nr:hypothetical protein psal_cds_788 [Pandoravirus salinus]AGO84800.1 hypothetical protein psal_cds_788 [Pandoravirus salinus]
MDVPKSPSLPPELWAAIVDHLPWIGDVAALGIAVPGVLPRPLVDEICARRMVRAPNRLLAAGAPLPIVKRLLAHWRTKVHIMALRTAVAGGRLDVLTWLISLWASNGISHTDVPINVGVFVRDGIRYVEVPVCVDIQAIEYAVVRAISIDRADMIAPLLDMFSQYPNTRAKKRTFVRLIKAAVERGHLASVEAVHKHARRGPWRPCKCPREIGSHAIKHNKVDVLQWMHARRCAATPSAPRGVERALRHNATEALVWAASLLRDRHWRIPSRYVTEALGRGGCADALARACALSLVDTRTHSTLAVLEASAATTCDVQGRPSDRHVVSYSPLFTLPAPCYGRQHTVYRAPDGLIMGRVDDFLAGKWSRLVGFASEADPIPRPRFGPTVIRVRLANASGRITLTGTLGDGDSTMTLAVCAKEGLASRRLLVLTALGNGVGLVTWILGRSTLVDAWWRTDES